VVHFYVEIRTWNYLVTVIICRSSCHKHNFMLFFMCAYNNAFVYLLTEESSLSSKTKELNSKDEGISALEKAIHEKSAAISTLQSEIESLQVR